VELREYLVILRKWAWLIVLGVVLASGTAFLVSKSTTPIYRASTTLLISQAREPALTDYTSILTSERLAKTYSELLKKRPVLEVVIANLSLGLDVEELAGKVDVRSVRDTQLIEVSVEDADPSLAARIANEIPTVFIERNEAIQSERFSASKESLSQQMEELSSEIEQTQERIRQLQAASSRGSQEEIARLEDNLALYRDSYSSLLRSYEEIRVAEGKSLDTLVVWEPAVVPKGPVSPRTLLNTALAGTVGAMLAVGVVFLIEYLDDTIKTPDDAQRELALPTLGTISRIARVKSLRDSLITFKHPRSSVSEAYRVLRTNIQFSTVGNPASALLVTSAAPLEGKTTTAANLAVVMAQAGKTVILVDTDLRRPALHDMFDLRREPGLTDLLVAERLRLNRLLIKTHIDGLRLLPSGTLPPNPAELLGSEGMKRLLAQLEEEAEVVILDSPPVLAVADASILASHSPGVLLVVDAGKTRSEACRQGKEALEKAGGRLLGVVLNKVVPRGGGYYYYHYYSSGESEESAQDPEIVASGREAAE